MEKTPELLPLDAADCAWGRLKENNPGSRIEAQRLAVFNEAADLSTYRRKISVRTTRATAGRYTESDPIGLRVGVNTYAYVGDNPVSNIDPRGAGYLESHRLIPGWSGSGNRRQIRDLHLKVAVQ